MPWMPVTVRLRRSKPNGGLPVSAILMVLALSGLWHGHDKPGLVYGQDQDAAVERVEACLLKEMRDKNIPGASMGIALDGELAFAKGYGIRRVGSSERVDSETIFRINSTTKMMAAAAVMLEVEAGRLDLHAPITDHLPDLRLKPRWDASDLSLHALLANAGAMPDPFLDFRKMPQEFGMPEWGMDLSTWAAGLEKVHLYAPPGRFWNYSSPNFSLAALPVERVSGMSFADYVTQKLWQPAGMHVTTFDPEAVVASGNYATGHIRRDPRYEPADFQRIYALPAGGAFSTPTEMIKWAQVLMRDGGDVLSPKTVEAMTTPYFEAQSVPWTPRSYYGYGIFMDNYQERAEPNRTVQVLRHPGNGRGYGTEFVWVPALGFAIVTIINDHNNMHATVDCALRELAGLEKVPISNLRTRSDSWWPLSGSYVIQDVYGARWMAQVDWDPSGLRVHYPEWIMAPRLAELLPEPVAMRQMHLKSFAYEFGGDQRVTFEPDRLRERNQLNSSFMRNQYFVGQRVGELPARIDLQGESCVPLRLRSGLNVEGFDRKIRAYGLSRPMALRKAAIRQDDTDRPERSHIKIDIDLAAEQELGFLMAWLFEESDDNLELYLMQDENQDGDFSWPAELVQRLTSAQAQGIFVPSRPAGGTYQLWVQGAKVAGANSQFDLDLVAVSGDDLHLNDVPENLWAGQEKTFQVCSSRSRPLAPNFERAGSDLGQVHLGMIEMDFGQPGMLARVPVYWRPDAPSDWRMYLPRVIYE